MDEPTHIAYARYFQDTLGCRIVPLWGIRPAMSEGGGASCRCPLGVECGKNSGKHAVGKWKHAPSRLPTATQNWGYVSDSIVVIDLDTHDAHTPWELPPTWQINTRNGKHLLYRWYGQPLATKIRIAPDIDLKAHGGLVVGPGSARLDGGTYEPANTTPIAVLPEEVARATRVFVEPVQITANINAHTSPFVRDTVKRMCQEMRSTGDGSRNADLFRNLCWLLRSGWAGTDTLEQFKQAAIESGLDMREVENCYVSAWKSVFG